MTKKDYELIASALKINIWDNDYLENYEDAKILFSKIADKLASKNPRFNKEKFLQACGVETLCKKCNTDVESATHRWGHCDSYCKNKYHYKQVLLNGFCLECGKRE